MASRNRGALGCRRPGSLLSSARYGALECSRISRLNSWASWPSGIQTAVRLSENSSGSGQQKSSPHALSGTVSATFLLLMLVKPGPYPQGYGPSISAPLASNSSSMMRCHDSQLVSRR